MAQHNPDHRDSNVEYADTRLQDVKDLIEAIQCAQNLLLTLEIETAIEVAEMHCASPNTPERDLGRWNRAVLLLETTRRNGSALSRKQSIAELRKVLSRLLACMTPAFYAEQRRYAYIHPTLPLSHVMNRIRTA